MRGGARISAFPPVRTILVRSDVSWRDSKALDPFRRVYRRGRAALNRFLHPYRRAVARRRVRRLSPVRRVLVLCLGNICRSPYGATRLAQLESASSEPPAGSGLEVRSAGLIGPGRPSPDHARSAARNLGLDLEPHTSRLLDPGLVAWAELLVVMESGQGRIVKRQFGAPAGRILVLGDLDPLLPDRRGIPDPIDREEGFFLETYNRMDRCLVELFTAIRGQR